MGAQLDAAIGGEPELAVGAIDDRKRIDIKLQEVVGGGQACLEQGENLSQQGCGSLASHRICSNCFERFSRYPLILHGTPNPTAVMPETAISAEHQMLTPGEMLIKHAGDNEFGGVALVLGPGRSTLR